MRLRDIPVRGEGKVEEREAGKQNGRSVMTPRANTNLEERPIKRKL